MEETKSKRGGYRAKAGRPKGSKNLVQFKKALKEYITEAELHNMIKRAKEIAKKDPKMLQFLLEQVFGKARATVGLDGGEDKPIAIGMLLDSLERQAPIKADIIQDGNRQTITGQDLEDTPLIQN